MRKTPILARQVILGRTAPGLASAASASRSGPQEIAQPIGQLRTEGGYTPVFHEHTLT